MTLRPESSVSVGINELGELQFACDLAGPVIHRTPEELGIPRVIFAPKLMDKAPERVREQILSEVPAKREGVLPVLPRMVPLKEHRMTTQELKKRVLAEPHLTVDELVKLTGASKAQIYNWRYQERKKVVLSGDPKGDKVKVVMDTLQRVTIDPQQPGTAAALIGALAKRDAASTLTVRVELTESEVAALIGKLSDAQRAAFLAGGVKAAILG